MTESYEETYHQINKDVTLKRAKDYENDKKRLLLSKR